MALHGIISFCPPLPRLGTAGRWELRAVRRGTATGQACSVGNTQLPRFSPTLRLWDAAPPPQARSVSTLGAALGTNNFQRSCQESSGAPALSPGLRLKSEEKHSEPDLHGLQISTDPRGPSEASLTHQLQNDSPILLCLLPWGCWLRGAFVHPCPR